jgi:DNA (cytosine-5)-methyltransferase 1
VTGPLVVENFAGPGGWSTGLRAAGYTGPAVGVEHDRDACRTAVVVSYEARNRLSDTAGGDRS